MTEKENFMTVVRGDVPEWVPMYSFGQSPPGKIPPTAHVGPSFILAHLFAEGPAKDIWGVNHVPVVEANGAKIPEPNNFIIKDIRKWRDVIKAPDISGFDWETMAKKDIEALGIDRKNTAVIYGLGGYFQQLMSFMGFSEGLCAMYEEPDEVKALMEYLCDFYMEVGEKTIHYYNPDMVSIIDDTATWQNPFISPEMYRDLIKPYHARQASLGTDLGLAVDMHDCGRCEDFIDDWLDFGVVTWNPAQTSNDLAGIKKKYGNRLVIVGGWDSRGELARPDATEEMIREAIYKTMDTYAPGGGYAFCGGFLGPLGDELTKKKNQWVADAAESYGRIFYKK